MWQTACLSYCDVGWRPWFPNLCLAFWPWPSAPFSGSSRGSVPPSACLGSFTAATGGTSSFLACLTSGEASFSPTAFATGYRRSGRASRLQTPLPPPSLWQRSFSASDSSSSASSRSSSTRWCPRRSCGPQGLWQQQQEKQLQCRPHPKSCGHQLFQLRWRRGVTRVILHWMNQREESRSLSFEEHPTIQSGIKAVHLFSNIIWKTKTISIQNGFKTNVHRPHFQWRLQWCLAFLL